MPPDTPVSDDDNRPPVEPNLAQLMDMLRPSEDIDLDWLFERTTPVPEDV